MTWPEHVLLDSPEAESMRREYEDMQQRRKKAEDSARPRLDPPADERVGVALDRCLASEPKLFWWLLDQMRLTDESGNASVLLPNTIEEHSGWKVAAQRRRECVLEAARRYLQSAEFDPADLMDREEHYVADRGPSLAVNLLWNEDSSFLERLAENCWSTIGPYLLFAPTGTSEHKKRGIKLAFSQAPDSMRNAVMRLIKKPARSGGVSMATYFADCIDDELAVSMLTFLRLEQSSSDCVRELLGCLLRQCNQGAHAWAESLLTPPRWSNDAWPRNARNAAICLLGCSAEQGWAILESRFNEFPEFGLSVLKVVASGFRRRPDELAKNLSDGSLKELLVWLLLHVPPDSDPEHEGAHLVGPMDELRFLRDHALTHMSSRGTAGACAGLGHLRDCYPAYPWLRDLHAEAQEARRRASWMPPSPAEFLSMVRDRTTRFVGSADQLQALIVESLGRYEEELRGITSTVPNLWNERLNDRLRPKDENHLSDNLAQHLRRDIVERGVVINREVEVRRRQAAGGVPGERTDIHIDAVTQSLGQGAAERISVIVEVKGCWNSDVQEAMKTQLVERYLFENQCNHDIYVLGWFLCDAWDTADYRKKETPWATLEGARSDLTAQAEGIQQNAPPVHVCSVVLDCTIR